MGIDEFDPISQPKILRSKDKMRNLPDDKKIVLDAVDTKTQEHEEVK